MHDAISLEKRGIPAAVICTAPFASSANAMAALGGIPDYPYIMLPHPVGSLDGDRLRERAIQAAPEVLQILLGGE